MPDALSPIGLAAQPIVLVRPRDRAPAAPGTGFHCDYLWEGITVLSDGNVTCGFDDPFGTRSYGNIRHATVREIFNGEGMRRLREKLRSGSRCETCHLYARSLDPGGRDVPVIPEMPRRLILETTIRCNLRCRNTSCDINNDRLSGVRGESFLDFGLYARLMDEVGPYLGAMFFFNYGEPFLHPRAVDMLAYAKKVNKAMSIATSTNGLLIGRGATARRIVEEELVDWMNFTIAGADDPTYQIYHKGGRFEEAFDGMRKVLEEKARLGKPLPLVRWRYLLFNWNDSDEQVAKARAMAREIGVDQFTFFLCSAPLEGRSSLRAPGTPGFQAIADVVDYEEHYRADPLADCGLYGPPEHDPYLGAHCWTSRRARLTVTAHGGAARIHLSRPSGFEGRGVVQIRTPWATSLAQVGEGRWAENEIRVPRGHDASPFAIEVRVDDVHIPLRRDRSGDSRELGVQVSLGFAEEEHGAALSFPDAQVVAPGAEACSAAARLDALASPACIRVENGEYAIDEGPFTAAAGFVVPGSAVRLRHASAGAPGLGTTTTVTIGNVSSHFTSYSAAWLPAVETPGPESPEPSRVLAKSHDVPVLDFVIRQYRDLLGREGDPQGVAYWSNFLAEGGRHAAVVEHLIRSPEFEAAVAPAVRLYLAAFQRAPDFEGLSFWLRRYRAGDTLDSMARALARSGEFRARYGGFDDERFRARLGQDLLAEQAAAVETSKRQQSRHETLLELASSAPFRTRISNRAFVSVGYVMMLKRSPDSGGFVHWVDLLNDGRPPSMLLDVILGSDEYAQGLKREARRAWPPSIDSESKGAAPAR